jgi:hypothetical protein
VKDEISGSMERNNGEGNFLYISYEVVKFTGINLAISLLPI